MYTIDPQKMTVADSRSDSSLLPSVEDPEPNLGNSLEQIRPITSSYTVDDRGLLNNYAVMPTMYIEETNSPSSEKKLRSGVNMLFALLITIAAILIALIVS